MSTPNDSALTDASSTPDSRVGSDGGFGHSGHTPGPWYAHYVQPSNNTGYRYDIGRDPNNFGWWVARVCNAHEAEANALLIAQAPALLAALDLLVQEYEHATYGHLLSEESKLILQNARETITDARQRGPNQLISPRAEHKK